VVAGAAGFIGQHLCTELRTFGHSVYGIDLVWGDDLLKQGAAEFRFRDIQPDVVVHLAAQVGRQFGEDDPLFTVSQNPGMCALVARAAEKIGARVVYASTSEVYGDQGDATCREDGPLALPHNLYGLSKRWGEEVFELYCPRDLTVLRFSMPYGPGLPAGRGRAAMINFLYNALHGLPITVHEGAERSWCWIGDTVAAARIVIEHSTGVFNIGRDDNATSMLDVAKLACIMTGASEDLIQVVPAPERQTVVKRLATDRIRSLGWQPRVDLLEGMERTLQYVRTL